MAEALRNKAVDKGSPEHSHGLNAFASPHGIPMLLTATSNERWKAVRCGPVSSSHLKPDRVQPGSGSLLQPC